MTEEKSVLEMHDKNEEALSRLVAERKEAAKWRQIAIEERAKILCYDQDSTEEWWGDLAEKGSQGHGKEDYREQAARELETEIGEHFTSGSNMFELTPERRAALEAAIDAFAYQDSYYPKSNSDKEAEVLRAMLEAGEGK